MRPGRAQLVLVACAGALACVGCAGTSSRSFTISDARTGGPVHGAHVRAVCLNAGTVPLPLNDTTIKELLRTGKTVQQGWTDETGRVRLALAPELPHVIEVDPPAFERPAPLSARYQLLADGSLAPITTPEESPLLVRTP